MNLFKSENTQRIEALEQQIKALSDKFKDVQQKLNTTDKELELLRKESRIYVREHDAWSLAFEAAYLEDCRPTISVSEAVTKLIAVAGLKFKYTPDQKEVIELVSKVEKEPK